MKKNTFRTVVFTLSCFLCVPLVQAKESGWSWFFSVKSAKEVEPMTDKTYIEECGACHFAYPAGLLPEGSWRKLLQAKALEDHFGENAELDDDVRKKLLDILVSKSADKSWYKRSRKIMSSLDEGETPLRISEVPYMREKHEDVKEEVVKTSKKVKSLSYCDKCHQTANEADFDDDNVDIPGYGLWTW